MQTASDFWRSLDNFAARIEQLPGTKDDRLREIVNAYSQAQSLGIAVQLGQLQALVGELADIERLISGNGHWDV